MLIIIVRLDEVQFVYLFTYLNFYGLKLQDLQIVLSLGKCMNLNLWNRLSLSLSLSLSLLVLIYDHSVWARSIVVRNYIIRN